jgi:hypothetical protein
MQKNERGFSLCRKFRASRETKNGEMGIEICRRIEKLR